MTSIIGELYEVDEYEGHPTFFRRRAIALDEGSAEAYVLEPSQVEGREAIPSGDWRKR